MDVNTPVTFATTPASNIVLKKWLGDEIHTYQRMRERFGWESTAEDVLESAVESYSYPQTQEEAEYEYSRAVAKAPICRGPESSEKYFTDVLVAAYHLYWKICFGKMSRELIRFYATPVTATLQNITMNVLKHNGVIPNE